MEYEIDNKPETNATTNCISAIFDINGAKKPNKLGTDVRTLNSIFGYKTFSATSITKAECEANKKKLGINACGVDTDYWAGAVKKCNEVGLHLPSMQTLANIAGAKYGRTDISPTTSIWANINSHGSCLGEKRAWWNDQTLELDADDLCIQTSDLKDSNSAVLSFAGYFWASTELNASTAQDRDIFSGSSVKVEGILRYAPAPTPLCVGD